MRLGFEHIIAAEHVGGAVESLKKRNWQGVEAIACNLSLPSSWNRIRASRKRLRFLFSTHLARVFKEIGEFLKGFREIDQIFYVSCETSSFARDAARLRKLGWRLNEVQPLDQFLIRHTLNYWPSLVGHQSKEAK